MEALDYTIMLLVIKTSFCKRALRSKLEVRMMQVIFTLERVLERPRFEHAASQHMMSVSSFMFVEAFAYSGLERSFCGRS